MDNSGHRRNAAELRLRKSGPRQRALAAGVTTYEGKPHSRCGGTKRWAANGGCVRCVNALARAFHQFPNLSETKK